ncbi:transposable element Tcb1 transposase [Trichonephila clavipes]|nr:transposable element Tcb1 transposase [Trichonephila clavipes]
MLERFLEIKSKILKALLDIKEEQMMANVEFKTVTTIVAGLKPVNISLEKLCSGNATFLTVEGVFSFVIGELKKYQFQQNSEALDAAVRFKQKSITKHEALKTIPPTLVEAERAFSAAGLLVTKLGTRLSDKIMPRRKQRSAFDQVSEFDRGRIGAYQEIADYLSGKSVVVLDETKQLYDGYGTVGCRKVRRTDVVDHIHLSAPLHIELLSWPARSLDLSPIENMWSMIAQRLTQITPPAATPDQLWQRVEAAWSAVPQEHI